jgi:hypothetical protein
MKKDIKEKFPSWVNDTDKNYTLCLSNDLDSLLSCIYLKLFKGYYISHFYTFNSIGQIKGHEPIPHNLIGVDIALEQGKTWDNHVTMFNKNDFVNEQSANLNAINRISRENYFNKYCGSTLLQILSYYEFDISNLSEQAKMILLCIDSSFLPFYTSFKDTGTYYMKDILGFTELVELTERHTKAEFEELNKKYNLKAAITVKKGYLHTDIDLASLSEVFLMPIELPTEGFKELADFKQASIRLLKGYYNVEKPTDVFSIAVTGRDYYKYSSLEKGELVC